MKRQVLFVILVLVIVAFSVSPVGASIQAVGSIQYGNSWYQQFHDTGNTAPLSFISITRLNGPSNPLEVPTFTSFNDPSWSDLRGVNPAPPVSSSAAFGNPNGDIYFNLNFTNNPAPLQLEYVGLKADGTVAGSDYGIFGYLDPIAGSTDAGSGWWWYPLDVNNAPTQEELINRTGVVPEPATILIWSLLGATWMGGMTIVRRRRHAWAPEARKAIVDMIESGRKSN